MNTDSIFWYRAILNFRGHSIPCCAYLVLCILTFNSDSAHAQLANSPWPDFGGGMRNTHQADVVGPSIPTIAWTYSLQPAGNTFAFRQPSIGSDGTAYFLTYPARSAETLVALRPDGTKAWSISGSILAEVGMWSAVDTNGQIIYSSGSSSTNASRIFARDAFTGSLIWNAPTLPTDSQSGPTISQTGDIFVNDDNGDAKSISTTGQVNWSQSAGGPYVNPAIDQNGDVIFGGSGLTSLGSAGNVLWSIPVIQDPSTNGTRRFTSPSIDSKGNIYVGTTGARLDQGYLLSVTSSGDQRWIREGISGTASIAPDGTIYAGFRGILHALNPLTGSDLWTYNTGQIDEFGIEGITIDLFGNLYIPTESGHVLSLDSDGHLRWDLDLAPNTSSDVFLSGIALGIDGSLYVGGGETGEIFKISNVPEISSVHMLSVTLILLGIIRYRRSCAAISGQ